MNELTEISAFLGWCSIINIGVLTYSSVMIYVFNAPVKKLHAKLTGIAPDKLDELYFSFLGNYKLAIFIFNLAPYCALKIMS